MRGRKPDSILAGSSPVLEVPKAPGWLSKDAKSEWKRVAPILVERKVLTDADLGTLESYCAAVGVVRECARQLAVDGLMLNGKRHPLYGVQHSAITDARLCAAELGLTPVSRSRPSIREDQEEDDDSPLGMARNRL
ncbi:phage terminase small subunit P27 family [Bosea sp. RCC_152_1]|uniref:phage terminase small subunit P27 family n=1 Tax=Bosea sp. RCC_152_1 TaxID=3239228 RepID=UPI0035238BAF